MTLHPCLVLDEINDCGHTDCLIAAGLAEPVSKFDNWWEYNAVQNWLRWQVNGTEYEKQKVEELRVTLRENFLKTGELPIMALVFFSVMPLEKCKEE